MFIPYTSIILAQVPKASFITFSTKPLYSVNTQYPIPLICQTTKTVHKERKFPTCPESRFFPVLSSNMTLTSVDQSGHAVLIGLEMSILSSFIVACILCAKSDMAIISLITPFQYILKHNCQKSI